MNIDTINEEWAADCVIDRNDLTLETLRTPKLHAKYLAMLMRARQSLIRYTSEYQQMRELRAQYYSGALSRDELQQYGWTQYQGLKPLKSDMSTKLDADSEVIKVKLKVQYTEAMVEQLEQIMYSIKGRDWSIKNHITWQQFQAGN